jgi:aspartyl-tRNA(Asn)/glutamyl-tRNA(Gln) amidotransferase subunit A
LRIYTTRWRISQNTRNVSINLCKSDKSHQKDEAMTGLAFTPAAELAGMIRNREISPVEVMSATLRRIEQSQSALNAFLTVAAEGAMEAAKEAEAMVMGGGRLGPLHGVPLAVKDLVPTADIRTTWGSLIFKDHVPTEDAVVIARLKRAGAIVVGKTTTPEFGQQCLTEAPLFGRTPNAWRADRSSGGSSGGSAVAVAAGLVPIAVATDGGGSTRIPAACNGVVGFKQGLGIVPQEYAPDGFGNISYITPMTRTVFDTALMLDAMAGPDSRDPLTIAPDKPDFITAAQTEGSLMGLRIGWRPRLGNIAVAREVLAACETALEALAGLGANIGELTAPLENPERAWFIVNGAYRMAQFGRHLKQYRDIMCPTFVRQLDRIAGCSAAELYDAIFQRTRLYRQVQSWFDTCDIVAMPTLSRTAVPINQDFFGPIEIDGALVDNIRAAWYPYTMPFNLTGNPAVTLPAGLDSNGLPLAIQLVAPLGADATLLRIAVAFERACPWTHRRPPVSRE